MGNEERVDRSRPYTDSYPWAVPRTRFALLKNDHARAIRFSTLTAICSALNYDASELLVVGHDAR
jgi:DNA-binding Xre family transcriptional regulator